MKKIVLLLIFVDIIFTFGAGLYGPIYAIFVNQIGGDILEAGMSWFIFMVVMGTLEIPFGKMADRYSKKMLLAVSYALATFVIFSYMFITNIFELFVLQVIVGVAFAIGDPAWEAWFAGVIQKNQRGFSFATFHALSSYSQAGAALAGGFLAQFLGFQVLFLVGGIVGLFSVILTLTLREEDNGNTIWHRHKSHRKRYQHKK